MLHPFNWLDPELFKPALAGLGLYSVLFGLLVIWQARKLIVPLAPHGIVSLQLAKDARRVDEILQVWGDEGRRIARGNVRLDFLFLAGYPLFLSLACVFGIRGGALDALFLTLSWAVLLAGPLDLLENFLTLRMLSGGPSDRSALLTSACAAVKFGLVLLTIGVLGLYVLRYILRMLAIL